MLRALSSGWMCGMLLAGCAARPPAAVPVLDPFISDDACYHCLERVVGARDDRSRGRAADVDRLVVLAIRSRELGLAGQPWLKRLESAAADRPQLVPLVELLRAWPAETSGWDSEVRLDYGRQLQALRARAADVPRVIDAAGLSPPVTAYLLQSFQCRVSRAEATPHQVGSWSGDRMLSYGSTVCVGVDSARVRAQLEDIASADLRWVEADLALARLDIAERRMSAEAERRLSRAAEAFPDSAAIWLALAQVRQARAELAPALEAYASVLRLTPDHRDALLGQTVCLSQMSRHDDAIVAASRLIDLGMYHIGDAHYWRAWSHLRTGRVDEAWADSERALALLYGTDAFTLSGIIALARGVAGVATERLQKAVALDGANCLARTQLGVSLRRSDTAAAAAAAFEAAAACHVSDAQGRRRELEDLRAGGEASASHVRSVEHAITEAVLAEAEAALQAADAWAGAGDPARALRALEPALVHPATRAGAEALAARLR